jgi:hypothetical protein
MRTLIVQCEAAEQLQSSSDVIFSRHDVGITVGNQMNATTAGKVGSKN